MASSSKAPSAQQAGPANDPAPPKGTRHITMWTDDSHQNTMIKFLNVPNTYELIDIKHVDHVGAFHTFNNGETWLTLDNKRLFLMPDMDEPEVERAPESPEDWPIMSPNELKQALTQHPSYEELDAMWQKTQQARRSANPLERRTSCQTEWCNYSYQCYPLSTSYEDCFRCTAATHTCTYRRILPNAIGPISGKRSDREEGK